ncbi:RDD family protein [Paenibacillus sp. NPDC058071]|uniref:RDD family protein n=1 Tax=Paenibacillus sp. NPDC058071 TaxID=3346326 RepID=UPI0036DB7E5A
MFYAGFWKRFCAFMIDTFVLYAILAVSSVIILFLIGVAVDQEEMGRTIPPVVRVLGFILAFGILLVPVWLYFALMESSPKQATLGKMALGIIVVNKDMERITFKRATGRFFSRYLTEMTFSVGYIMAAFSKEKQALHDMVASTYVVNKRYIDNPDYVPYPQMPQPIPSEMPVTGMQGVQVPSMNPEPYGAGVFKQPEKYSGFWKRLVAMLLDGIILSPILIPVTMASMWFEAALRESMMDGWVVTLFGFVDNLVFYVIGWMYYAGLESSPWQATLGKRALGIIVVDSHEKRLTFLRASGRHCSKVVSMLTLYVGFIMAGFTVKKQALHDKIAGAYVLNR